MDIADTVGQPLAANRWSQRLGAAGALETHFSPTQPYQRGFAEPPPTPMCHGPRLWCCAPGQYPRCVMNVGAGRSRSLTTQQSGREGSDRGASFKVTCEAACFTLSRVCLLCCARSPRRRGVWKVGRGSAGLPPPRWSRILRSQDREGRGVPWWKVRDWWNLARCSEQLQMCLGAGTELSSWISGP